MLKKLYRILLTINSLAVFVIIYIIKEKKQLPIEYFKSAYISYLIYFILIILFSAICLKIAKFLPDEIITGGIKQVESANGSYLPSYLGYFFVALSINDFETFVCVGFVILFLHIFQKRKYLIRCFCFLDISFIL